MSELLLRADDRDRAPSLRDLAAVFFRWKRLLWASFLLVFGAGFLYRVISPSYESEMKVLLRHGRIDPAVTPTETAPPLLQQDIVSEEDLNSQAELLRDQDVLREVVRHTGLADRHPWISSLLAENDDERIAHAVKKLASKLDVTPIKKSQLIAVTYKSSDPRESAAVLRSLATAYMARQGEIRRPSGQQMFFEQQMQESRAALESAQENLLRFSRQHGVASAALERDLALQRWSETEAADLGLRASLAESSERIRSLERELNHLPELRVVQTRNTDNPQLDEKLKSKLLELELKRTELLTRFQPSYRLVTEVDEQIAEARAAIAGAKPLHDETTEQNPDHEWANSERIKSIVEMQAMQKKEAVARFQVTTYRHAVQRLARYAVKQTDLEDKLKAAEDKYLLYSNKREEARIGDALDQNGILNVALAEPPQTPALPASPLWISTCLAFAAACVISTGSVFAADYVDQSVRTPDEVSKLLGAPVLVSLPLESQPKLPKRRS